MKIKSECNLAEIVVNLLDGKTMIFPTETSYGLGCDATNQNAVDSIFAIKGRSSDKPLLVVVPTIEMAKKYLVWNETLEKIATNYWPGPLTVIGEYKNGSATLARGVVAKDGTVAMRVSSYELLKSITEKIDRPLVATSGNVSDKGDTYDANEIVAMFKDCEKQPDSMLNYGILPKKQPTTIIKVTPDGFELIRQGEIKVVL